WRKKVEPARGRGRLLNPVVGDGEGGDSTGYSWRVLADAGDRVGAAVVDAYPGAGIARRLALQVGVVGVGPSQHARLEVVEDELAEAGAHGQHRVAVAIGLARHRHQQVAGRHARLHQPAALLQRIVLAVAEAAGRIGPDFLLAP